VVSKENAVHTLQNGRLSGWRMERGAMLEHHRNAIVHRIVAATTIAVQPRVGVTVWTGGKRLMAYRANNNPE